MCVCVCVCVCVGEGAQTSVHLSPPDCVERVGPYRERGGGQTSDPPLSVLRPGCRVCLIDPREMQAA